MTKDRIYIGKENISVNGKEYAALKFKDEYSFKSLENEGNYNFHQLTYYAPGIGMVKYERYYPNGRMVELELSKILTVKEFNEWKEKAVR